MLLEDLHQALRDVADIRRDLDMAQRELAYRAAVLAQFATGRNESERQNSLVILQHEDPQYCAVQANVDVARLALRQQEALAQYLQERAKRERAELMAQAAGQVPAPAPAGSRAAAK